jgi:hypothetical protein
MRCDSVMAIAKHDLVNCERGQEHDVKCEDGGSEASDGSEGWKERG